MGAAAAYRLASTGNTVQLIDAGHAVAASGAAAGVISPGSVFAYGGTPPTGFEALALAASLHYEDLVRRLREDGQEDCGYSQPGALVVATNDEERAKLDDVMRVVEGRVALGVANIGKAVRLTGDEARSLHPLLGDAVIAAIHLPEVGRVDGAKLVAALRAAAAGKGAEVINDDVTLEETTAGVRAIGRSGAIYEGEVALVAAGCWTDQVVRGVGVSVPVAGEGGEMVWVRVDGAPRDVPIVMGFVHTRYTLPVGPELFGLGATQTPQATQPTVRTAGVASILEETLRVAPAFGGSRIEHLSVGNRPVSPDRLPLLGQIGASGRVYVATGHGSYGLMQGPFSGELVADLARGVDVELDLSPYSPSRFAEEATVTP